MYPFHFVSFRFRVPIIIIIHLLIVTIRGCCSYTMCLYYMMNNNNNDRSWGMYVNESYRICVGGKKERWFLSLCYIYLSSS